MSQLQDGTCAECEPILRQTRDMLRIHLEQVENDIADPGAFRNQNQYQNQVRTTQTPPATDSPVIKPQQSCTPALDGTGQQNGNNNPSAGTPMPQNQ